MFSSYDFIVFVLGFWLNGVPLLTGTIVLILFFYSGFSITISNHSSMHDQKQIISHGSKDEGRT